MMRAVRSPAVLGAVLGLLACSTGSSPPGPDTRTGDTGAVDVLAADTRVWPDRGRPDRGPKGDAGLCGNKRVDDPPETCDKGITAGQEGACPTSVADCDDSNTCTTDSLKGSAADCTAECGHAPISNCCGNGTKETGEECDDGNVVDSDGCSKTCKLPGGHLLLTEVAVSPGEAEFLEIYNPSTSAVSLDKVYLADRNDYFVIPTSKLPGDANDFVARFPAGATLGAGQYATVAVNGMNFKTAFGKAPDYELASTDSTVPDMAAPLSKAIGSLVGLTDGGELAVLFTWDGTSDRVQDLDYVVWKGSSATMVYKSTLVCVDGPDTDTTASCFKNDTAVTAQSFLPPPQQGGSLHRCNYKEGSETLTGGNGATGHDETSEPFDGTGATWKRNPKTLKSRTPGGPAPPGFCPP